MKKILSLTVIFLLFINAAFADRPKVYCKLQNSSKVISLTSAISYNGGGNLPNTFITGNDRLVTKDFTLGKYRVKFKLYFPKEENGRALNASTTVHVNIYLNGKEILNTKHFGQPSDYFVGFKTNILCRAYAIYVALDRNNQVRVRLMGKYTPKHVRENKNVWGKDDELGFDLDYLASSGLVNDVRVSKSVTTNTDRPNGLQNTKDTNNGYKYNASTKSKKPKKPKKKHDKKKK